MKRIRIFLIRNFYRFFNPVRKLYWFVFRPKTRGVKCVVEFQGSILLTKLSYAHRLWTFPGGGVNRNESFSDAAIREVKEETGIDAVDVKEIGEYTTDRQYKLNTVKCFGARAKSSLIKIDESEVSEAEWFDPRNIPDEKSKQVKMILDMFVSKYE